MIQLEGKYSKDCKIWTDNIDQNALQQVYDLINSVEFTNVPVRVMPDVCAGETTIVGLTYPLISGFIAPSHIGSDAGCSVSLEFFSGTVEDEMLPLIEHRLKQEIPSGKEICASRQFDVKEFLKFLRTELQRIYQSSNGLIILPEFNRESDLEEWLGDIGEDLGIFYKSIGSIGSGNHYIELDLCEDGRLAFTVHTGSRSLGLKVFKKWQRLADSTKISQSGEKKIRKENKGKPQEEIERLIIEYKKTLHPGYLMGENLRGYLTDIAICQIYARWNHKVILEKAAKIIAKVGGGKVDEIITTTHNYIDFDTVDGIPMVRKGSVRANEDEVFLLPFNMRDGLVICKGKGNVDWNCSCSHGSGRKYSRSQAKKRITLKEFEKSMKGICSTSVCQGTIDESPMAYKDTEEIIELIKDTADIEHRLKPLLNIKGGGE